jgi:hypothetical protein
LVAPSIKAKIAIVLAIGRKIDKAIYKDLIPEGTLPESSRYGKEILQGFTRWRSQKGGYLTRVQWLLANVPFKYGLECFHRDTARIKTGFTHHPHWG